MTPGEKRKKKELRRRKKLKVRRLFDKHKEFFGPDMPPPAQHVMAVGLAALFNRFYTGRG